MRTTSPKLSLEGVSVQFDAQTAVDNISFDASGGSVLAITGPNGSGKSTLLNVIAGLIKPTQGNVISPFKGSTAYLTQSHNYERWMPIKAIDIIKMGLYKKTGLWRRIDRESRQRLDEVIGELHITAFAQKQYWELSGGQKQRVRLAQTLIQNPKLLLLDEPFTGLDAISQQVLVKRIDTQADQGSVTVLATHNLDLLNHCKRCDAVTETNHIQLAQ